MRTYAFQASADLLRSLLWQHNSAERLQALARAKQVWHDTSHAGFWQDWLHDVFDLRTANGFGCKVWAKILGAPVGMELESTVGKRLSFGFGASGRNFGHGNFGRTGATSVALKTEQMRILLRLRYFQLVCRPTAPEINRIMAEVFGDLGRVYVRDDNDMSFAMYIFTFSPDTDLRFLLDFFDILPRPAAVGAAYQVISRDFFGFGGPNRNFGRGALAPSPKS